MIYLDTYIHEYNSEEPFHIEARKHLDAQMALYTHAWALRARITAAQLLGISRLTENWRKILKNFDELAQACLDDRELSAEAGYALKDPALLANRDHSPLTATQKFFDKGLVAAILECAGVSPNMELDRFDERLRKNVGDAATSLVRSLVEAKTDDELEFRSKEAHRWLYQFPSFEVTGGVREKEFGSSPADLLMLEGENTSLPFEFSLQIAFTSNALTDAILGGDAKYSAADDNPWDFPGIKKAIHEKVMERIRADTTGSDEKVIADVSEFVLLQRLFRMGLSGDLGPDFPIEKLVELTEIATKSRPPLAVHTLRWDSFPGQLEQLLFAQIMFGLNILAELEHVSQKESFPYGELKRILAARQTQIDQRLQKWDEFREEITRSASQGGDPNGPWDRWEAWDKVWQRKWADLESLDSVILSFAVHNAVHDLFEQQVEPQVKPLDQSPDPAALKPDAAGTKISALKRVVVAIDASISALEMRQALGVSGDDRRAHLQRVRRIASWRRLMGAVSRSNPPQT
jgi:hypothetical protein